MNDNVKALFEIVKDEYSDCDISDDDLEELAEYLEDCVFCDDGDLVDILDIVYMFEQEQRADDVEIDVGRQCSVYSSIIRMLELNKKNAKRIYESYLVYHDLTGFFALMEDYEEWLTKKQRAKVLSIAKQTFIKPIWDKYT